MRKHRYQASGYPVGLRRLAAASILLLSVGCEDPPTAIDRASLSADPIHQFAGGTIRITSLDAAFREGDVVVSGPDTLAVESSEPSRLTVRLPGDWNGPRTVVVRRGGEALGRVEIEAHGFLRRTLYAERFTRQLTDLPTGAGLSIVGPGRFGAGTGGPGLVWIEPSSGVHRWFPGAVIDTECYRVGVDPRVGELYAATEYPCERLEVYRIAGGELSWQRSDSLPCWYWGCEPLSEHIWLQFEPSGTCRIDRDGGVTTCEAIDAYWWNDEPQGLTRLYSADVALIEDSHGPVYRISTGELAYVFDESHPAGRRLLNSAAADETRGVFYTIGSATEEELDSPGYVIRALRGTDGVPLRQFVFEEHPTGAHRVQPPEVGYDPERDVIFVVRGDTWSIDVLDPESFELRGRIAIAGQPYMWDAGRVVVDTAADLAHVVVSLPQTTELQPIPGTPVITLRLPPR